MIIAVTSKKDKYMQDNEKFKVEIQKLKQKSFDDIDDFVENTNPKVILKIILKILLYIIKKII